jgi:branched-chain amino acid transport system substrate-binding protein
MMIKTARGRVGVVAFLFLLLAATGAAWTQPTVAVSTTSTDVAHVAAGKLPIAAFMTFTGVNGADGPELESGCQVAVPLINAAGGVLGNTFTCIGVDNKSDPADAVPAANQMLAQNPNLELVIGTEDSVAPPIIPLLTAAKVPMFSPGGDPRYDHNTDPYFFRLLPSDDLTGVALAEYAVRLGYRHAAALFTNDPSAQTTSPSLDSTYPKLGGHFSTRITLTPGATSYRTELESLLATHPDAVITEMDDQTSSTVLGELQQLTGGHLPPIITDSRALDSSWPAAVSRGIGFKALAASVRAISTAANTTGPAYATYKHELLSQGHTIKNPVQYASDAYAESSYDAVTGSALAMLASHSTKPSVWRADFSKVTTSTSGATVVYTFAQGKKALAQGKHIVYVGAGGPINLNKYQNRVTSFQVFQFGSNKQWSAVGTIPASALLPYVGGK